MEKEQIFLYEPDKIVNALLERLFYLNGYYIESFSDLISLRTRLRKNKYGILIIGGSGSIGVNKEICNLPKVFPYLSFILLSTGVERTSTAEVFPKHRNSILSLESSQSNSERQQQDTCSTCISEQKDFDAVLHKPFHFEELLATVEKLAGKGSGKKRKEEVISERMLPGVV